MFPVGVDPELARVEVLARQASDDGRRSANVARGKRDGRVHGLTAECGGHDVRAGRVADERTIIVDRAVARREAPCGGEPGDRLAARVFRGDREPHDVTLTRAGAVGRQCHRNTRGRDDPHRRGRCHRANASGDGRGAGREGREDAVSDADDGRARARPCYLIVARIAAPGQHGCLQAQPLSGEELRHRRGNGNACRRARRDAHLDSLDQGPPTGDHRRDGDRDGAGRPGAHPA